MKMLVRWLAGILLAGLVLLTVNGTHGGNPALAVAPPNDNLANAIAITSPTQPGIVATSNNADATTEPGEQTSLTGCQPAGSNVNVGRTVWYSWTSPGTAGSAAFDTWGSTIDTVLTVYSGSGSYPLTPVACNDDRFGGTRSAVSFNYAANTTYYIQLGSFGSSAGGDVVLNMSLGSIMYVNIATDNIAADGNVTLREAISAANVPWAFTAAEQTNWTLNYLGSTNQKDLVHFAANLDINLGSALPILTGSGDQISGIGLSVEVDGQNLGFTCLTVSGSSSAISGLRIRRCSIGAQVTGSSNRIGIAVSSLERNIITENTLYGLDIRNSTATSNLVSGNFIGTDGASSLGNGAGVVVEAGAANTTIGGTTLLTRNIIDFNSTGVVLTDSGTGNVVSGNYIGVLADGSTAAGNQRGVSIFGNSNTVGGSAAGSSNVISSNTVAGVQIQDGDNNTLQGNYIGLAADGATARANSRGVWFTGTASGNRIGGSNAGERNVIAGNTNEDVLIDHEDADANVVSGNYIGISTDGSTVVPSPDGASIGVSVANGADNNVIGGSVPGAGNVISGYTANLSGVCACGVAVSGNATGTVVSGNFIGTDATGMLARPNGYGVYLVGLAIPGSLIGGDTPAERNVIAGNNQAGIAMPTSIQNTVAGNYIGLAADGTTPVPNGSGITISGQSSGNRIGGSNPGERNVISSNLGNGVMISGSSPNFNYVRGNYIGLAADGVTPRGNEQGIFFDAGTFFNTIGGNGPGLGNVIAGNTTNGIFLQNSPNNSILGNLIGLAADGNTAVPNTEGIYLSGADGTTIGEGSFYERNVISGNADAGIWIDDGSDVNNIHGNYIGLDATGTTTVPNNFGVYISGASDGNTIGGSMQSLQGNTISGNTGVGVAFVQTSGTNYVKGNFIGTDPTGATAIDNFVGVSISNSGGSSRLGDANPNLRNIISGNTDAGVIVGLGAVAGNVVQGNYIGTSRNGMSAIPNASGVVALDAADTFSGNLISGNTGWGMDFSFGNQGTSTLDGNWIGPDATYFGALGNGAGGIRFHQHPVNVVTMSTTNPNTIAFNGGPGVSVDGVDYGTSGQTIRKQSIHSNAGLGIDLTNGGNANKPAPTIGGFTGTTVSGFACPGCTVDVYSDSGGEGRFYHASATANGVGQWSVTMTPIAEYITVTATDASGNTSEFASLFAAEPCDGIDNDGDGLIDEGNPDTDLDGQANCIDPDDDNDTHADNADGCPLLQEDLDGFQDSDGCPDSDNDMDGVCDPGQVSNACSGSDYGQSCFDPAGTLACTPHSCANIAEDFDGFHDGDGCPDPDNDNDGRPDAVDTCPGDDSVAGPDGMLGSPQDVNHNGIRDGAEPALTTDDSTLTFEDYDGVLDSDGCHDSPGDDFDGDGLTDETEVFSTHTNPGSPDTDADTIIDGTDNCPNWPNTPQNTPDWFIPAGDSDCDNFTDAAEVFSGTDPTTHCAATSVRNDEGGSDRWPSDFDDNQVINIIDVSTFSSHYGSIGPNAPYAKRWDFNGDNKVNIIDVSKMSQTYGKNCS